MDPLPIHQDRSRQAGVAEYDKQRSNHKDCELNKDLDRLGWYKHDPMDNRNQYGTQARLWELK